MNLSLQHRNFKKPRDAWQVPGGEFPLINPPRKPSWWARLWEPHPSTARKTHNPGTLQLKARLFAVYPDSVHLIDRPLRLSVWLTAGRRTQPLLHGSRLANNEAT